MTTFATKLMTSRGDGEKLYAKIGRWLASPEVRRECGGYPINDGPDYRWLIASGKRDLAPVAFLNFEHKADRLVIHNAYVDPDARGNGAFRELLRQCLSYADHHHLPVVCAVQAEAATALEKRGFTETSRRGAWIKLQRSAT